MAASVTNIALGPCSIIVDGTDIGHTIGGTTLKYTPTYHDTVVDKYGKTVVEKWLVSEKWEAEFSIAEFTFANLKVAMPEGTQTSTKITLGAIAGKKLSSAAHVVVLHPNEKASNDKSADAVFYKGVISGPISIDYKSDGERILKCQLEGLIDESRSDGNLLGLIGDSTT